MQLELVSISTACVWSTSDIYIPVSWKFVTHATLPWWYSCIIASWLLKPTNGFSQKENLETKKELMWSDIFELNRHTNSSELPLLIRRGILEISADGEIVSLYPTQTSKTSFVEKHLKCPEHLGSSPLEVGFLLNIMHVNLFWTLHVNHSEVTEILICSLTMSLLLQSTHIILFSTKKHECGEKPLINEHKPNESQGLSLL